MARTGPGKAERAAARPVRARSVKSRIVVLLILPVVALIVLWAFAAAQSLEDGLRQSRARTFTEKVLEPTDQVIAALQDERRMSLSYLGDDATIGRSGFDAQRAETDRARELFRGSAAGDGIAGATRPETRERMSRLADALGGLEALRQVVDARTLNRAQALGRYTEYIELAAEIYDEVHSLDPALVRADRVLRTLERARENLAREDALVTGALAAGSLSEEEHLQLVRFAGTHRFLYGYASRGLPPDERARYEKIMSGPQFTRFKELEDRLMRGGPTEERPAVDIGAWHTSTEDVDWRLTEFSNAIRSANTAQAKDEANAVLLRLGLTGGLGLVAVVVAVLVAIRAGRRLVVECREMAASVTAFADRRLTEISERARRGEPVRDDAGDEAGAAFRVTEIEQIDRAFAEARRAVVRAAEGEAAAHKRLNEVFVTLARRNQSLVQRLLRMLEGMQRGTEDPDELRRLFELDSLATRMRRHAEGLVILSGRPSGRSWRDPVRLVDVARAAVSEIEDYARVDVVPMGRAALRGPAVADTIHLLAELIENAAAFSPPDSAIRVTGQRVVHGFALEVEDRGLGIEPSLLAQANRLLATDPELDLDDSARLGLFVVARLAARHGIQVSLRRSPYGGLVAIVLIPEELVVEAQASRPSGSEEGARAGLQAVPGVRGTAERDLRFRPAETTDPVVRADATASPRAAASGEFPLPARRRQASLAPRLRARREQEAADAGAERSPEAARDLMSALLRGRHRAETEHAGDTERTGDTQHTGHTELTGDDENVAFTETGSGPYETG
ncbi:nitrate- and nitrite sensing domain-containing protein, partial [Actinomadura sp. KC345]|uniref:sensor histidine kinase n=1 Tax=Actinomadura sp. KC345 TaxID=2530371 RepID=UPI001404AC45